MLWKINHCKANYRVEKPNCSFMFRVEKPNYDVITSNLPLLYNSNGPIILFDSFLIVYLWPFALYTFLADVDLT